MCWHAYHTGGLVFWEDFEARVKTIMETKPECEHAERLRWFKPVEGELPEEVVAAARAYHEAWEAWLGGSDAGPHAMKLDDIAWAYIEVCDRHRDAIEALHAIECPDCSWANGSLHFCREAKP